MRYSLFHLLILSVLLTACIKQTSLYVEDCNLISFRFEKQNNPQLSNDIELTLYGNNKIVGYLTEDIDPSNLIATFDTEKGEMYVNKVLQVSQKTSNSFEYPVRYTLKGENGKSTEFTVTLVAHTGLPVAIIHTNNEAPLKDRDNWLSGVMEIDGKGIIDDFKDSIQVKGRGNGSWKYPKKPFNVKLNNKASILGMPKQKRWSFLANYRDRTLLRNDVTFHLGYIADNLAWTPKSQFVEVIFNGVYQGNFQLCEQIKVDKNRVNIEELTYEDVEEEKITGGYLLEYDSYFDEINKFRTNINKWPVNIKEPDEEGLNPTQLAYIKSYTNTVEELLSRGEFSLLFDKYIDMNSFVDYWIVQALVGNKELSNIYSVYCYKARGKKLCAGPLWDFDFTTFTLASGNDNKGAVWYKYLFNSPAFKERVKQRFTELKPQFMEIPQYIDEKSQYLSHSVESNWKVWPIDLKLFYEATLNKDEALSYKDAIDRMKMMYQSRLEWLETIIYNL